MITTQDLVQGVVMADHDLLAAFVAVWISDLNSPSQAVASEARGFLKLSRLAPAPLIEGAAIALGVNPTVLIDTIEQRAGFARRGIDSRKHRMAGRKVG